MAEKKFQAVKGMNDILPAQSPYWQYVENTLKQVADRYGYNEIRFPIVEHTTLFERTIGQATDIVEKEMYTFDDHGDSLTLRPEGTAGCVRAAIEHGLLHNQIQRLWYMGPMYRHEQPQKGRYRQFYQFGIEAFGLQGPDIDAEQILMTARVWQELGIQNEVSLQLNSLGSAQTRAAHRQKLIAYFTKYEDVLDPDSRRRLVVNPLRILDSKVPQMQDLIANAPKLTDFLDEASREHFDNLRRLLDDAGLPYQINPRLVRGLDYYGLTVYEWTTSKLGAQNAIGAGGRYDTLVEQLGGQPTPAVGFAVGFERIIALVEAVFKPPHLADAYLVLVGDQQAVMQGLTIAEKIRSLLPELKLITNCGGGSFKNQFKRADKSGAQWAFIIGDDELATKTISVKNLRGEEPQQRMTLEQLVDFLRGK